MSTDNLEVIGVSDENEVLIECYRFTLTLNKNIMDQLAATFDPQLPLDVDVDVAREILSSILTKMVS